MRALMANDAMQVEERRRDLIGGRIQTLTATELALINEHDELLSKYDNQPH